MLFGGRWVEFEINTLSKINQTEEEKYHKPFLIRSPVLKKMTKNKEQALFIDVFHVGRKVKGECGGG
jgi:hypothetical protein